jgi:outer membrane protein TolC
VLATLQPDPIKKLDGPAKKADGPNKIKELLKERRDVLQKAADQLTARYQDGRGTGSEVMLAQKAVLEATLDLAETSAERIDALGKALKLVERIQAMIEAQAKAGQRMESEALQARAMVLEVRIRLLREEQNAKATK